MGDIVRGKDFVLGMNLVQIELGAHHAWGYSYAVLFNTHVE
jgi:hypothetical protein